MVKSFRCRGVEMKTKIETLPLDQTEVRKEGNRVKMLTPLEIQGLRKRSLQAPLKTSHNLNISLPASLPMQRSQVILLKTQACNKIKSSLRETMMNKPLTRRLPKLTSSRNSSDLQLLVLIGVKDDKLTSDLLRPGLVKLRMLKNLLLHLMSSMIYFSAFVINWLKIPNLTQEILVGPAFNLLKGTCKSITELEYYLEECSKETTERLDWHNPENKPYLFDLRKPLSLIQDHRGRQIIHKDYFINKDLEYLKGGDLSRRYSTSVTKSKAATYELKWIEDLVPEFNLTSSKDVYSKRRIIAVTRLIIMKKYDYGHLEEIEVRRDDQKLYTFKEDEKNKSYDKADYKKKLYDALVKSYNTDKDLFDSYGEVFSLKRSRDKDKDRDPSAGSDRQKKRRKSSKDVESFRDSRSKEKKSSSTSKDASQSQHKSSSKSAHAEELSHTIEDLGIEDKLTSRPPQTWISQVAHAEEPPTSFDELNDTLFDFSAFVINRLKIPNLTQEILGGDLSRRYSTSVTKTKAATYDLKWIEDLVQELWSPVQVKLVKMLTLALYTGDQMNRNRLMRADELHKFSDGMLDDVRSALNDIAKGIRMEYLPMRKWSNLDKKRARVMVQIMTATVT
ncbi:hypothetical protein Tco_0377464 [Tanacetum coccineum]